MSWADLGAAVLRQANLTNTILCDANLDNTLLEGADLTGTKLSRAYMGKTHLAGAKLNGTQVGSLKLSITQFRYPEMNAASLKKFLSVYAINDISGVQHNTKNDINAQLNMIDSIDEQYADVKIRLIREMIASLENIDVSSAAARLRDFVSKAPYAKEGNILERLNDILQENLEKDIHQPELENLDQSRLNETVRKKDL
ncbi:pentapeptide repeat-containing protein [Acerihabitans sp. KWT182]|uniref:Pentapeptide repeat-containing protein n=1 Tax=Acerihabitans sp. KWT182 TaxID=3157919 RepID=A0AAU7QG66_9GAMM